MADISKITASNGTTYDIKDQTARDSISQHITKRVSVKQNDDLDSYTTAGIFCSASQILTSTLSNCPVQGGFLLEVIHMFDVVMMQRLSAIVGSGVDVYMRKYHPSLGWNTWVKL